jgi:DtxR family Mn-dependent transcriptional regulator
MTPGELFLGGLVLLAVAAAIFWPGRGIIARLNASQLREDRIRLEDALKHLYDLESNGLPSTPEGIAKMLSMSAGETAKLTTKLESLGLLKRDAGVFRLTAEGRSYALRIIRVHRLWERYLADETTFNEAEWHTEAEKKEHLITAEQASDLDRRLGHPAFDPHGDPIPSATGEMPEVTWKPLMSLNEGESGGIVHIEDEPPAHYAQLIAQGFYPGLQVRIIERTSTRIRLEANGNEIALAPALAANLSVVPLAAGERKAAVLRTLATLKPGERGIVSGISPACRGLQRRRLMDLGVVPGAVIEAVMESLTGDPIAYSVRGATIALRKLQADMIFVEEKGRV